MATKDDRTVEEKITDSVHALWESLEEHFTGHALADIVTAATPEITKHYLKGQ